MDAPESPEGGFRSGLVTCGLHKDTGRGARAGQQASG